MKLEYRYGQTYLTDLHQGDMITTCGWYYRIITTEDIDESGNLKTNMTISAKGVSKYDRIRQNRKTKQIR